MTFFVVELEENKLLTHDGEVQLGIFNMSLESFMSMTKVKYQETYWIPDVAGNRYKRVNYQKHINAASIGTKTTDT